jgi:hypothetical protein
VVKKRPETLHEFDEISLTESDVFRRKISTRVEFMNDPQTLPLGPPKYHPFAEKQVSPWDEWVQTVTLAVETYL